MVSMEQIESIIDQEVGRIRSYRKGDILVSEGEDIRWLTVVLKGEVSLERLFFDGSRSQVEMIGAKDLMGVECLSSIGFSSYYFYIANSAVTTYEIPALYFRRLSGNNPGMQLMIMNQILSVLANDNSRHREKLDVLSTGNLRTRIQTFLYYQKKRYGSNEFSIPFNREQMASYLCVNRSALSRELGRMQDEGLIRVEGNHFLLLEEEW